MHIIIIVAVSAFQILYEMNIMIFLIQISLIFTLKVFSLVKRYEGRKGQQLGAGNFDIP